MTRKIIGVESDLHGANKLALMNPAVVLEDIQRNGTIRKYTPAMTESQRELWELRQENIKRMVKLAGKDELHYAQDGDPTQGNKHPAELVSTRIADQITIAVENTKPIMDIKQLKSATFLAGTAAHNFGQASADITMVSLLRERYPKQNINLCYHGLVHYGDFVIDFAHHGPYTGSREWLKGNVARYYLQSLMFHQVKQGNKPPDIVIRGHYHTPIIETVRMNGYTSHIIVMPSMCMIDDFAHMAAKSPDDVTCGMMCVEINDNKLVDIHQFTRTYDTRTEIFI
jgi:hypothetical protein